MSQRTIHVNDQKLITYGYDHPFNTYFWQLWDTEHDPDFTFGAPVYAAGYHPIEQSIRPFAKEYGKYPLSRAQLVLDLIEHQIDNITISEIMEEIRHIEK